MVSDLTFRSFIRTKKDARHAEGTSSKTFIAGFIKVMGAQGTAAMVRDI